MYVPSMTSDNTALASPYPPPPPPLCAGEWVRETESIAAENVEKQIQARNEISALEEINMFLLKAFVFNTVWRFRNV